MEPLEPNDAELIAAAIASGYEPENVDKTPTDEDGPQPEQPYPLAQYGVLPEEDPYG